MADHRGILVPAAVDTKFTIQQIPPSADLAPFVTRYWVVRWNLDAPYQQETLPYPCVNLVIGTHQPGLFGPMHRRFVADLDGRGGVFGTKFTPAGFRAFYGRTLVHLVDRVLRVEDVLPGSDTVVRSIERTDDDAVRVAAIEAFLRAREPVRDPAIDEVNRIVELARAEPAIARVAELAERVATPTRTLERLFRGYIGMTPKWVIQRFRVQEAAERVARGAVVDWCALVHELGYYDQAHFIRAFKAQIGRTPAQYAAECAARPAANRQAS